MSNDEHEPRDLGGGRGDEDQEPRYIAPWASVFDDLNERYRKMFSDIYSPPVKNLTAGRALPNVSSFFPEIKTPNLLSQIKAPTLGIDPTALGLGKSIADIIQKQQETRAPFAAVLEQQRKQWDSLFTSLRTLTEALFPPNWKGVKHAYFDEIEAIVLDEGIPLAWVPSPAILQAVFDAPDAAKRREIIGRRWKRVVTDCEAALGEVTHAELQCHQPFAADIVRALRAGHVSAAQALAANLLESILRRNFDKHSFKKGDHQQERRRPLRLGCISDQDGVYAGTGLASVWRVSGKPGRPCSPNLRAAPKRACRFPDTVFTS